MLLCRRFAERPAKECGGLTTTTVAALQPSLVRLDPEANYEAIRTMVGDIVAGGSVDVIVLPEAFDGVAPDVDATESARDIAAASRQFIGELARSAKANVVGGSIADYRDDGQIQNVCVVADRAGRIVGEYAKRTLFAIEAARRTPGDAPGIFELEGLRVAVLICADLWYPELARELRSRADLLCVPAKSTVPSLEFVDYARTLWWSMAMTRSVENVLPVVVSDWCERAHDVGHTSGAASVNDPAGRPDVSRLQQRIGSGGAGALVARIDLDAVAGIRQYRRAVGLLDRDPSEP